MTGRIPARSAKLAAGLFAVMAIVAVGAGTASATVIYNNVPKPMPGNLVSQAFEATQTSEFGGQVEFAGTARKSPTVVVAMSSWACQNLQGGASCVTPKRASFVWPITLNVYEVGAGNEPGSKLASVTQNVAVPYRPSANKRCPVTPEGVVGWSNNCWSGKAFTVKFTLPAIELPSTAILSIAYNTTDYGYTPTHTADVGEDSLNVGLTEAGEPFVPIGSAPLADDAYINSVTAGNYCANEAAVGTFALSEGCWTGYQPSFKVSAKAKF
jgi:hypothetical protein